MHHRVQEVFDVRAHFFECAEDQRLEVKLTKNYLDGSSYVFPGTEVGLILGFELVDALFPHTPLEFDHCRGKKERKKVVTSPIKKAHNAKHVLGAVLCSGYVG